MARRTFPIELLFGQCIFWRVSLLWIDISIQILHSLQDLCRSVHKYLTMYWLHYCSEQKPSLLSIALSANLPFEFGQVRLVNRFRRCEMVALRKHKRSVMVVLLFLEIIVSIRGDSVPVVSWTDWLMTIHVWLFVDLHYIQIDSMWVGNLSNSPVLLTYCHIWLFAI